MRALRAFLGVFLLAGCGEASLEFAEADWVLTNGVILTMNSQNAVAEAVETILGGKTVYEQAAVPSGTGIRLGIDPNMLLETQEEAP